MNNCYNDILFQNEKLIIVDKCPNVLSVRSRLGESEKRACLGTNLEHELGKKIFPVHRLDYEVSGLIIYAFDSKTESIISKWFEDKTVLKTYEALAIPHSKGPFDQKIKYAIDEKIQLSPKNSQFNWECLLDKGKKRAFISHLGKKAITKAKLITKNKFKNSNLDLYQFHLFPITGRSHQLRFELYRHGLPILGDKLYGQEIEFDFPGIALKAIEIDFSNCLNRDQLGLPDKIKISGFLLAE